MKKIRENLMEIFLDYAEYRNLKAGSVNITIEFETYNGKMRKSADLPALFFMEWLGEGIKLATDKTDKQ